MGGVADEVNGGFQALGQLFEGAAVGAVSQDLHAQGRRSLASPQSRRCADEGGEVVAGAQGAGVGGPQLAGGLGNGRSVLGRPNIEGSQVVADVDGELLVGALPVGSGARCVLVGGPHGGGEQLVDPGGVSGEGGEGDGTEHGDVQGHAHGLGPEIVDVGHEGDAVGGGGLGAGTCHVVGRDLGVDEVEGMGVGLEAFGEEGANALGGDAVAADSREVEVALVAGLVDEAHPVGQLVVAGSLAVALSLLPVLERGGDEVDLEPLGCQKLAQEAEARVAAHLVAQLHAHGHHGDAPRAHRGIMQVWGVCSHGPIIAVAAATEGRMPPMGSLNIELGRLMAATMPESAYALKVQQNLRAYERAVRRTWCHSDEAAALVLAHTNAFYVLRDERPRKGPRAEAPLIGEVCIDDALVRSEVNAQRELLLHGLACEGVVAEELRIVASRRGMRDRHPFARMAEAPRGCQAALEAPARQRRERRDVLRRAFCLVFGERAPWVLGHVRAMEVEERLAGRRGVARRGEGRLAARLVVDDELTATLVGAHEQPLMAAARDLGLPLERLAVEQEASGRPDVGRGAPGTGVPEGR